MNENRRIHWQRWLATAGLLLLIIALWPAAESLYDLTGEEQWRGQLVGIVHWLNTAVRPQPDLALDEISSGTDISPLGVNVFLQQEVEPEKRAQSLEMASQAGFHFIRQEFQWEDIEIHGKGDFVDRRNDPEGVDAWAKYDNVVDLAEVKRAFGNRMSLSGNVNSITVMLNGTPGDVEGDVRRCMDAAKAGGGFILSVGDQTPYATPEPIMRAFVAAGRALGAYGDSSLTAARR